MRQQRRERSLVGIRPSQVASCFEEVQLVPVVAVAAGEDDQRDGDRGCQAEQSADGESCRGLRRAHRRADAAGALRRLRVKAHRRLAASELENLQGFMGEVVVSQGVVERPIPGWRHPWQSRAYSGSWRPPVRPGSASPWRRRSSPPQ